MSLNTRNTASSQWEGKFDTIEEIFSYLYSKTNDSW